MSKNNYILLALLAIALTVLAAGCSNNRGQLATSGNSTNTTSSATATPEPPNPVPTDNPDESQEPVISPEPITTTEKPTTAPATAKPVTTTAPTQDSHQTAEPHEKPTHTPAATPTPKPVATVKPTETPAIVLPSAMPTATPSTKPSTKPSAEPSTTPKPSILPIVTPSPSPKPTTKPDPNNPSTEVTVADIAAKLASDAGLGTLHTVEGEQIKDSYNIDAEALLVDGIFKQPQLLIQAGEFSIVQLKSDKSFADVEAGFKKRAEAVQSTFESYLEDQYEQAQNYQIIRNGDFVLFSISPDQSKTAELFNSFFKK